MKRKQIPAIILMITMSMGLFAGCGDKSGEESQQSEVQNSESETQQVQESQDNEAWKEVADKVASVTLVKEDPEHMAWMDTTSPVTLTVYNVTVMMEKGAEKSVWGYSPVQQKITELTGVTLDVSYPVENVENEFTLLLASGDELPDIINNIQVSSNQYRDLVENGDLYDIRELIEEYCPEMWDNMDLFIRESALDEDGHMYYLPQGGYGTVSSDYTVANGWFAVRGDVCEYFDIDPESITTLADMEELMQLYLENKDLWPEIKYTIMAPTFGKQGNASADFRPFTNIFGGMLNYSLGSFDMQYDKEADSVSYWIEEDYGYQAIEYMWSLAQKGYVDETYYSVNSWNAAETGEALFYCGSNTWWINSANSVLAELYGDANYVKIPLISAEEGQKAKVSYSSFRANNGRGVVIPKDCSDPERAIKFLEFLGSEYGNMLVMAGVYGEDWVEDTDEFGVKIIKYIGEAETAEGRIERGIYDHQTTWFNSDSTYDLLVNFSTGDPVMKKIVKEDFVFNTYATVPVLAMQNEPSDSEYMKIKNQLDEIMKVELPKMILAEDKATLDELYQNCLEVMNENGLDKLKTYVLSQSKDYITKMEAYNVEFQ